ncbi:MAG: yhfM [Bacteroidetes bacterium]|nr:yhfM [Bacteroidota bacterium]
MADQTVAPPRELSLLQTSSLVVGTVIGSGVFLSLPIVARIGLNPWLTVLIWFLGGVVWIPQILILAEMGTAYPIQGGPYFYLNKAGSPFLAFFYTWTAFLTSDTPTLTIVALGAISALKFFSPVFGDPVIARVLAAGLIIGLALLHYRSVRTGGNLQIVLTVAKLTPLFAIVIIGMFFFGSGNLAGGTAPAAAAGLFAVITAGISSTLWSYAGFTNILYMAGEVKRPERTLPIALIGSLGFVMLAYVLIALCTSAIVPYDDLIAARGDFVNPFQYIGLGAAVAGGVFAVAVFISMLGVLNASIMVQPRLEYAIARDGLFFNAFGHLHPKYLTPDYSILIQSALAIVLFLLGDIENMIGYFTVSYALQNGIVYGAIFALRKRDDYRPSYRSPWWKGMAILAILTQIYVAAGTFLAYPTGGLLASLLLILSGLPVYFYYKSQKRSSTGLTS